MDLQPILDTHQLCQLLDKEQDLLLRMEEVATKTAAFLDIGILSTSSQDMESVQRKILDASHTSLQARIDQLQSRIELLTRDKEYLIQSLEEMKRMHALELEEHILLVSSLKECIANLTGSS